MNLKKTIAILFTAGALSASAYLFLEKNDDQGVNQTALPESVLEIKKEEKGEIAPIVFEEKNDINNIEPIISRRDSMENRRSSLESWNDDGDSVPVIEVDLRFNDLNE